MHRYLPSNYYYVINYHTTVYECQPLHLLYYSLTCIDILFVRETSFVLRFLFHFSNENKSWYLTWNYCSKARFDFIQCLEKKLQYTIDIGVELNLLNCRSLRMGPYGYVLKNHWTPDRRNRVNDGINYATLSACQCTRDNGGQRSTRQNTKATAL